MRFALVNNIRDLTDANTCKLKIRERFKRNDLRHDRKYKEGSWVSTWKSNFSMQLQDAILVDKNIVRPYAATIKMLDGLVVQFQTPDAECFKKNAKEKINDDAIWLIDGMRHKRDYQRFRTNSNFFYAISPTLFRVDYPEMAFPVNWTDSRVPVVFDFRGEIKIADMNQSNDFLYCLYPGRINNSALLELIPRSTLIETINNGLLLKRMRQVRKAMLRFQI